MKKLDCLDLHLAQIALGCDHYGESIPEKTALAQLDAYVEAGGNLLDTAHVYGQDVPGGPSTSETLIGAWLRANDGARNVVVATKGCHPPKENLHQSRLDERNMLSDISQSLDNLHMDKVDIWFFHRDRPDMGVDEIVDMANLLVDRNLVAHLGTSNWTVRRIAEANAWAQAHGKRGFEISEIQWSLAHCTPESWGDDTLVCMNEEELAWYRANDYPVMCFSSQAKGFFSKMIAGKADRLSVQARSRFLTKENLARVPKCKALSEELGVSPAAVCMAYLTSQKSPTIAIAGSSRIEQLADTLKGADLSLSESQLASLQ